MQLHRHLFLKIFGLNAKIIFLSFSEKNGHLFIRNAYGA